MGVDVRASETVVPFLRREEENSLLRCGRLAGGTGRRPGKGEACSERGCFLPTWRNWAPCPVSGSALGSVGVFWAGVS